MTTFSCQCAVTTVTREPECPLPVTQEDFLCDFCRDGHPEQDQHDYDRAVALMDGVLAS